MLGSVLGKANVISCIHQTHQLDKRRCLFKRDGTGEEERSLALIDTDTENGDTLEVDLIAATIAR